jgi:2-iminoacetate synthase
MNVSKNQKNSYLEYMEEIKSDTMNNVLSILKNYNPFKYTEENVLDAIKKEYLDIEDFATLLSPIAENFLEEMAYYANKKTMKYFGNSVSLFTPLYISNYCENHCSYCGFNYNNKIKRGKLTKEELEEELISISQTGLEDILLLTGESRSKSGLKYIGEAVKLASKYFKLIGIEIYPLNSKEYQYLHDCGADYVCVYQETYDKKDYEKFHLRGPKTVYSYRFNAQERAIKGGMRKVSFGCLLGLGNFRKDAFATGLHGYFLQKKYPQAEISFSLLRLRPFINSSNKSHNTISESILLQIILAHRLFMPFSDITISTRERQEFRDGVVGIAATKMSASVKVGVGGHKEEQKGDEQFEILDSRSVDEITNSLYKKGLQPVFIDYIYL